MEEFLLLIINGEKKERSEEEKKKRQEEFFQWVEKYSKSGNLKNGHPLSVEGRELSYGDELIRINEINYDDIGSIAGYFFLEAESWEDAVEIANESPHMEHGGKLELRKLEDMPS